MALGTYKYVTPSKPTHRYAKKTYKKSYKSKRTTKPKTVFKTNSMVMLPREAYVKMVYKDVRLLTIAAGADTSLLYNCMSIAPRTATINTIATGDKLITGIPEYSVFYDNYTPTGAKIKVTITNNNSTNLLRFVVLPRLCKDSIGTDETELDAMTYEQLISMPSAQARTISLGTGGQPIQSIQMYRKTKYMLDIKDIKDNSQINFEMPVGVDTTLSSWGSNDESCWYYYVAVFNIGAGAVTALECRVEMIYYMLLRNRQFIEQLTAVEP